MNIAGRRAYLSGIKVESKTSGDNKGDFLVCDLTIPLQIRKNGELVDDDLRDWLKEQLVRPQILDPVDFGRLREIKPEEATPAQIDRLESIKRRASMHVEMVQPVPHAWARELYIHAEAALASDFDDVSDSRDVEWDDEKPPRLVMSSARADPKMRVEIFGDMNASVTFRLRCRTSFLGAISPLDMGRLQRFPVRLDLEVRERQLALAFTRRPSSSTDTPILDSMLDGA